LIVDIIRTAKYTNGFISQMSDWDSGAASPVCADKLIMIYASSTCYLDRLWPQIYQKHIKHVL